MKKFKLEQRLINPPYRLSPCCRLSHSNLLIESVMPIVAAQGKTFECESGANLRRVLLQHGIDLYNSQAKVINCRGIGTCGTCAVQVEGAVSEVNWKDKTRRALPPHLPTKPLRLACQTRVLGDIKVTKFDGFWGQGDHQVWSSDCSSSSND